MSALNYARLASTGAPRPRPVPRAPLPPWPEPVNYSTTPPGPINPAPSVRYWRGNFWGVSIPGAPPVPGGNPPATSNIIAGPFLDRYPAEWQNRILYEHARRGYTHYLLWAPDSILSYAQTVSQFVDTCQRVKAAGFYTVVNLLSKVYNVNNGTWADHVSWLLPIMQALTSAGVLDIALVGMELDLWNVPGDPLQTIINGVTDYLGPRGVLSYVHFSPEKTWWGTDGTNRFLWWSQQVGRLQGLAYQTVPSWTPDLLQGHIADTRIQFSKPEWPFDMVIMENQAEQAFETGESEDQQDLMGWLSLCGSPSDGVAPMGFLNGARYPDGSVI